MFQRLTLLFSLLAVPVLADDKKPGAKADAAALEGVWEVVTSKFDGNDVPSTGRTLVFGEKSFTAYVGDKKGRTLAFTLNPNTDPKRIDLDKGGDDGQAYGNYSIDKDELKLCYGEPGAERPKAFESRAGSKVFLLVLKRVKG